MISAHLKLRNDEAKATVLRITGELAGFAETSIADATRVLVNARRFVAAHPDQVTGGLTALVGRLSVTIERATQVVKQTRTRLAGDMPPSATRLVSMHDPHARPIAKGRLGKPVEFGYYAASRVMPRGRFGVIQEALTSLASHRFWVIGGCGSR